MKEEGQKAKGDILKEEMNLSISGSIPIFPLSHFSQLHHQGAFINSLKKFCCIKEKS